MPRRALLALILGAIGASTVPAAAQVIRDVNCDGTVDDADRPALVSILFLGLGAGLALAFSRSSADRKPEQSPVERGGYLARAMACADCHTPWHVGPNGPEPDASKGLSGHPEGLLLPPPPALPPGPWMVTVAATNTAWSMATSLSSPTCNSAIAATAPIALAKPSLR